MNTSKPQIQSMEQLSNAEVALNTFLALSLDLFCIRGQDGYFKQLNPAWEIVLGWTNSELLHTGWIELVHPDDVATTLDAIRQCIPGNGVEYTNRYRHKDGSYRWFSWRVIQRQDGLFYGVGKDITAAKESEAALCDRKDYQRLIATLSTKFINLCSDEIEAEINQSLREIGEFTGCDRSYLVLFSEEGSQANIAYDWYAKCIEPIPSEWRQFSAESFPWWMATLKTGVIQIYDSADLATEAVSTQLAMRLLGIQSIVAVPMLQGQSLLGYLGLAAIREKKAWSDDIVALLKIAGGVFANALSHKQAESKLRESEQRFRAVFNQTFQLSSLLQLDGRVLEDNQTAMDFCQLDRSAVIGRPFWELPCWTISPEVQNRLRGAIAEAAAGKIVRYEEEILTPDNTALTIDFSLKPLVNERGQAELLIAEGRDLSGRKQVEQELQRAIVELTEWQNRYKAVGQISGQLLYEWNSETNELIWGENVEQVLGYSQDELENRITQWDKLVHPDDLETNLQAIARCKVTKEPIALEYRMCKKDGTYITVADKGQFYPDRDGNLKHMVGFIVDISDADWQATLRKQAEAALQQALNDLETRVEERTTQLQQANEQLQAEIAQHQQTEIALRQSEQLFRLVFEEAPIGMALAGLDYRFLKVNRAFCEMLGYTEFQLIGFSCMQITHPEDLLVEMPYVEQVSQGEIETYTLEKRFLKQNQEVIWVNLTSMALRDASGKVIYGLSMVEDITARKQAQEALQESEQLLRAIVEDQTELICRFKPEGTLTFVNDAYCRYFNKERSELIGKNYILTIPEEDQELVTQCFSCLSQEQPIVTYEHQVILPSGEIRWHQWTDRALFDEQGHLIELQAVGRDITPLKQAEAEIRKALNKERELSELRSGFVALVSHEFRNPLTTIQSSVDLLQRYNNRLSDEQKLNHFTRIHSAMSRLIQLLDDVLMIGKAEAGKLSFEPAPIDLVNFCSTIVENLQISASVHHEINFVVEGNFTNAQMDEKLLGHIVNNLLSNAIKYSPEGGTVQFDLTCNGESVTLRIQDNGIGIPSEYLEQMFETFQRAKNVGSIPGTGLGLAIVKKCVDLHGGTISVDSNVGAGTAFIVTLPLNSPNL